MPAVSAAFPTASAPGQSPCHSQGSGPGSTSPNPRSPQARLSPSRSRPALPFSTQTCSSWTSRTGSLDGAQTLLFSDLGDRRAYYASGRSLYAGLGVHVRRRCEPVPPPLRKRLVWALGAGDSHSRPWKKLVLGLDGGEQSFAPCTQVNTQSSLLHVACTGRRPGLGSFTNWSNSCPPWFSRTVPSSDCVELGQVMATFWSSCLLPSWGLMSLTLKEGACRGEAERKEANLDGGQT